MIELYERKEAIGLFVMINDSLKSILEETGIKNNHIVTNAICIFLANFLVNNSRCPLLAADEVFLEIKSILSQIEAPPEIIESSEEVKVH